MPRATVFVCVCAGLAATLAASAEAASVDVRFEKVSSNAAEDVSDQLRLVLSASSWDSSTVDFTFSNNVGIRSSISEIYFDDGRPARHLASGGIHDQSGASFVFGFASPGDLPSGNTVAPPFSVTPGLLADASGGPSNGLDHADDYLTIRFDLLPGLTFGNVADAFRTRTLRVGLHIRSIGDAQDSDAYVTGKLIPLPGAAAMGGVGLLALGMRRRR